MEASESWAREAANLRRDLARLETLPDQMRRHREHTSDQLADVRILANRAVTLAESACETADDAQERAAGTTRLLSGILVAAIGTLLTALIGAMIALASAGLTG